MKITRRQLRRIIKEQMASTKIQQVAVEWELGDHDSSEGFDNLPPTVNLPSSVMAEYEADLTEYGEQDAAHVISNWLDDTFGWLSQWNFIGSGQRHADPAGRNLREQRRIIREEYQHLLNEVPFHDSADEDRPGKKQTVTFDSEESYEVAGDTHGEESHAIKHYAEFEPDKVQAAVEEAISIAQEADSVHIIDKGGNVVLSDDDAKKQMNVNSMLNTLDLINDKQKNNEALNDTEEKLVPILQGLTKAYDELIQSYLSDSTDVDVIDDVDEIKEIIGGGTIVKFTGAYKGKPATYYLNPSDTGLVAEKEGVISTLFRIDKRGGDLKKVAGYFGRGVELTNSAFGEALGVGAEEEEDEAQPQEEKKKKKERTQQAASSPEDFVKQLKARGLPDQALKGALTGWLKKNAPDRIGDVAELLAAGREVEGTIMVERWQKLAGVII